MSPDFQIEGTQISNPELTSEKSKQWSFGGTWDATQNFSIKADYWNIKIEDVISFVGAQTIVDRNKGTSPLPIPAGLVLGLWFVLQVLNVGMGGGVAWFAHIGGFLTGLVLLRFFMVGRTKRTADRWSGWRPRLSTTSASATGRRDSRRTPSTRSTGRSCCGCRKAAPPRPFHP